MQVPFYVDHITIGWQCTDDSSTMVLLDGVSVLDLSAVRTEPLARSPLTLVVCQARYNESLSVAETRTGLALQKALGGRGRWRLEEFKPPSFTLTAVSAGSPSSQTVEVSSNGWQLFSVDGQWTATVLQRSVALETTSYGSWADFVERLSSLLRATGDLVTPEFEERLGLRYINHIDDPAVAAPAEWQQWIRPEVLGLVNHQELGPSIVSGQQNFSLAPGDDQKATVRHGFTRGDGAGLASYIMDIDTYRDGIRPFDLEDILSAAERLNRLALALFQSMITTDLYSYLHEPIG